MIPTVSRVGCGARVPDIAGPVHRYMESLPGCWAAYGEIIAREYGDIAFATAHSLTVDSYAIQHPGQPSPQSVQSVGLHLAFPLASSTRISAAFVWRPAHFPCVLSCSCWTEGAAGLPTNTSHADIRGGPGLYFHGTSTRVHPSGLTQPSIGDLPLHCILRFRWFCSGLPVPIRSQSNAPAAPPVQLF